MDFVVDFRWLEFSRVESQWVEPPFFIPLRQDCSYSEIRCIRFQNDWFLRVKMAQDGGRGKSLFQFLKGFSCFFVPFSVFLIPLGQFRKGSGHPGVVLDEALVKVGKP